jgi:ubiquinone/menaquinone biosynthesis C-methylase UbiE
MLEKKYITLLFSILVTLNFHHGLRANHEQQANQSEYNEKFITILQIMWGKDFLTPGGNHIINEMVKEMPIKNKKVLDFGCGIGGPAFYLAQQFQSEVVGVDIDPTLIAKAEQNLKEKKISNGSVSFKTVSSSYELPFSEESFDIVFAKESILHVSNKAALFII